MGGSTRINALLHFNDYENYGRKNYNIVPASVAIDLELKSDKKVEENVIDPEFLEKCGLKEVTECGFVAESFYTSSKGGGRVNSFQAFDLEVRNKTDIYIRLKILTVI